MGRIIDYPPLTSPPDALDKFIIETAEGTKTLTYGDLKEDNKQYFDVVSWKNHTFRGKNLGNTFTEAQAAAIANGSFDDIFLGDYWEDETNDIVWRIADFDYAMGFFSDLNHTVITDHHVVIVPDDVTILGKITNSANLASGILGCDLLSDLLYDCNNKADSFFGESHELTLLDFFSNSLNTEGFINGTAAAVHFTSLLREYTLYGGPRFQTRVGGLPGGYCRTLRESIFSLFRERKEFVASKSGIEYWTGDISSYTSIVTISSNGAANYTQCDSESNMGFRGCLMIK